MHVDAGMSGLCWAFDAMLAFDIMHECFDHTIDGQKNQWRR